METNHLTSKSCFLDLFNCPLESSRKSKICRVAFIIILILAGLAINYYLFPHMGYYCLGIGAIPFLIGIGMFITTDLKDSQPKVIQGMQGKPTIDRKLIPLKSVAGQTPAQLRSHLKTSELRTGMCDFSLIESEQSYLDKKVKANQAINGEIELSQDEDRSMGILLGMATGDALGAPIEFLKYDPKGYAKDGERIGMKPGEITGASKIYSGYSSSFHLKPGQWTDDTSMGLCLADILIQCKNLVGTQLMWAFTDWWHYGYNNAFTKGDPLGSVGLGGNINQSYDLFNTQKISRDSNTNYATTAGNRETSGNGSLMRNGPIAIFANTLESAMQLSWDQSKVTHQGDEAAACCMLMSFLLFHAIHSKNSDPASLKEELWELLEKFESPVDSVNQLAKSNESVINSKKKVENWNWKAENFSFNPERLKAQPGYIGSYAMDALAMALHCIYTTDSFENAILKAISHGGDADSVGAIVGQIAGAIYGVKAIPKIWIETVWQWDRGGEIAARALVLNDIREGISIDD